MRGMHVVYGKKGQAMAETVIMIPLLLLLLAGIYQFTVIMGAKMKLLMVARECMMICATSESPSHISEFAKEYGEAIGLKKDALEVRNVKMGEDAGGVWGFVSKILNWLGLGDVLYGQDIYVTYSLQMIKPFWPITGSKLVLKESLHTGVGNVFDMNLSLKHLFNCLVDYIGKGIGKIWKWLSKAF